MACKWIWTDLNGFICISMDLNDLGSQFKSLWNPIEIPMSSSMDHGPLKKNGDFP